MQQPKLCLRRLKPVAIRRALRNVIGNAVRYGAAARITWRERGELARVFRHWRVTGLVGLFSVAGSLCWFAAFTMTKAAHVKALGQVELVFTVLAGFGATNGARPGTGQERSQCRTPQTKARRQPAAGAT